jgi:hypothetical protein
MTTKYSNIKGYPGYYISKRGTLDIIYLKGVPFSLPLKGQELKGKAMVGKVLLL